MQNTESWKYTQIKRACEHCGKRNATIERTSEHTSIILYVCEQCNTAISEAKRDYDLLIARRKVTQ